LPKQSKQIPSASTLPIGHQKEYQACQMSCFSSLHKFSKSKLWGPWYNSWWPTGCEKRPFKQQL